MAYHILSIDGGGIYGMLSLSTIARLHQEVPFLDKVELFAGTSIGGAIALALADDNTPEDSIKWMLSKAEEVFKVGWYRKIGSALGLMAKHSDHLRDIFGDLYKDRRLGELKKKVLIPTYDLDSTSPGYRTWKAKFFHNFLGSDTDSNELIADIAYRSCTAPTYFPTAGHYCDGSLATNNPSLAAICQSMDDRNADPIGSVKWIKLISFGKRVAGNYVAGGNHDWGIIRWALPLIGIVRELDNNVVDYQVRTLLKENYCRVAPVLSKPSALDDYKALPQLVDVGQAVDLSKPVSWLKQHWA